MPLVALVAAQVLAAVCEVAAVQEAPEPGLRLAPSSSGTNTLLDRYAMASSGPVCHIQSSILHHQHSDWHIQGEQARGCWLHGSRACS